jgi:hypothetical protein
MFANKIQERDWKQLITNLIFAFILGGIEIYISK